MGTIPDNFLGLPDELCGPKSGVAVLPVPYDATTSFRTGTRYGPRAIITASQQVEWYDPEYGGEFVIGGIHTLPPLAPDVSGPEAMVRAVQRAATQVVRNGQFLLMLGGEHSITAPAVAAVRRRHKRLSVLQIDAHADLRDSYEGSPASHACVMRRIHDAGIPFIGVGIRSYSAAEARFMKRNRIHPVTPAATRTAGWIDVVVEHLTDDVYVTLDIDGFDPAFAPGTGTPEPGGLDWAQFCELIGAVASRRRIVAADVVEVFPTAGTAVTEFLAAKAAYKLIAAARRHRSR